MTAAALTMAACGHNEEPKVETADAAAPAPAQPDLVAGGALGGGSARFQGALSSEKGTPDINSVPTEAPVPQTSNEERDKTIAGLIADRSNARYSEQGGRTQPVAVRPFVDTPEAQRTDAVARLDTPAPERPAEPSAEQPMVPPPAAKPVAEFGPQVPGVAPRRQSIAGDEPAKPGEEREPPRRNYGGFRPLAEFQSAMFPRQSLAGTLAMIAGNLTANDRNMLNTTARAQIDSRGKGVVRIVGHGSSGLERAVSAASELQRMGVSKDNIFVGSDNVAGPVEVFFDRAK